MPSPLYDPSQALWAQLGLNNKPELGPRFASNDDASISPDWYGPTGSVLPSASEADEIANDVAPRKAKPKAAANPAENSSLDAPTGMDEQIAQQYLSQLKKRQGMVDSEDAMLEKYKNGGQTGFNAVDLKPLLAYADSLYGLKTAGSYEAPETPDERNQKLLALTQAAQKSRGDLSDDQMAYLKMKADNATKLAKAEQQAEMMSQRYGLMVDRYNMMGDKIAGGFVKSIHDDPNLLSMRNQAVNIDKAREGIVPGVPMKALAEYAQDIANGLTNNKGGGSDYKLKSVEVDNLKTRLTNVRAFALSNPGEAAPDNTVAFWANMANRLSKTVDHQMGARAQGLLTGSGTAYSHVPGAVKAGKEAADLYTSGKWRDAGLPMSSAPNAGGGDDVAAKQKRLAELEAKNRGS